MADSETGLKKQSLATNMIVLLSVIVKAPLCKTQGKAQGPMATGLEEFIVVTDKVQHSSMRMGMFAEIIAVLPVYYRPQVVTRRRQHVECRTIPSGQQVQSV